MELPFLPSLRKSVAFMTAYYFPQELVKGIADFGTTILRAFPRGGAAITLKLTGQEQFVPSSRLERIVLGEEKVQIPEKEGENFLRAAGINENITRKWGAHVGYPMVIAGMIPFFPGKKQVVEKGAKPVLTIAQKLVAAIKGARPIRKEAEVLMTAERARRAAKGIVALEKIPGERGFITAKAALKGELPKPEFAPIKLAQQEVDELFDMIKEFPKMDFYDKITTQTGLAKILGQLGGQIPTTGEIRLLENVFGKELGEQILLKRPWQAKVGEFVLEAINMPRTLMTSMDMSAPLRQGLVMIIHRPKQGIRAFGRMFQFFGSERMFRESVEEIARRKTAPLMKQSGLFIADITGRAVSFTKREEAYMSKFAEKIPLVGRLVRASERAYVGFLNKLRADTFDDIAGEYLKGGMTPETNPEVFRSLADFVNVATGRGGLAGLEMVGPALNGVFFSPRFMTSRLAMFNPAWYASMPPLVRKEAAKSFVKFVSTGVGILSMASLAGAKVEIDPRSADFAKIRIGNMRWDIWGGFQQWTRFTAQMILGETKSSVTGKIKKLEPGFATRTRLDWIHQFAVGKLAPMPALTADLMRGQTLIGEEITLSQSAMSRLTPLYVQDIRDAIEEVGLISVPLIGGPAFFGVGTQVYGKKKGGSLGVPQLPALPKLPALPTLR